MTRLKQSLARGLRVGGADEHAILLESLRWLWGGGSGLLLVSLAFSDRSSTTHTWLLIGTAAGFIVGLFALVRLKRATTRVALVAGLAMQAGVTLLIVLEGDPDSFYAFFYAWVVLHAGFFLPRWMAAVQVAVAGASYAGVLVSAGTDPDATLHWVLLVGSLGFAAALTSTLRARIRELIHDLRQASRSDSLTGFLTRTAFDDRVAEEIAHAGRQGRPICVVAIDLDHFKRVNDLLGSGSGDTVLTRVAALVTETLGPDAATARVGGAEFLLLLPDTDAHGGLALAEQLRLVLRRAFDGQLTASLGIAAFPVHGAGARAVLRAAEQALHAAKELGRDRSIIYTDEVANILARAAGRRGSEGDSNLATILTLAEALDLRDMGTARHSETVGRYAESMARELGLGPSRVERVRLAGILHDIGKIGVRDSVLLKPGKLTEDEYAEMRKHPEIGARIVASAGLDDIRAWVAAHHEHPDGRGYPCGLAGDEIPLEARILAVADAYEAMTADRVYRPAMSAADARAELRRCAGAQFDAAVVDAFLRLPDYETGSVEPQWAA